MTQQRIKKTSVAKIGIRLKMYKISQWLRSILCIWRRAAPVCSKCRSWPGRPCRWPWARRPARRLCTAAATHRGRWATRWPGARHPLQKYQNQPPQVTLVGESTRGIKNEKRRRHGRRSGRRLPTPVCHPCNPRTQSPGGRKFGGYLSEGTGWVFEGGKGRLPRLSWCNKGCRSSPMFDS